MAFGREPIRADAKLACDVVEDLVGGYRIGGVIAPAGGGHEAVLVQPGADPQGVSSAFQGDFETA
jgi:hypothetical protein